MAVFPLDVIVEILSRLPVKPLLRFRCVSKPLCALIDSHDFIRSHLKLSDETRNHLSLILWSRSLYSVDFASLDNAVELDHPLISRDNRTEVLGSSDGLICLINCPDMGPMAIWNPSTRRCHKLPILELESLGQVTAEDDMIYGFGYDSVNDDYKVVSIFQMIGDRKDSFVSFVKVYSMKSNSWGRIQDFPYCHPYKWRCGVFVGSALHWIVRRMPEDTANLIAAFDLTNEDYKLVPQPEFSDNTFHMYIAELGGCLCILCNYDPARFEVWVMKDYGVKESWIKLFSIAQPEEIRSLDFVVPVAYSKSGCEVLLVQEHYKLVSYDLEHKTIKKINILGIPNEFDLAVCVESLVPLNGGGKTYGKNQGHEREKKKKKRDDFLSKGFKLVL
ncbi:F-box protein CPR1 [Rhododendron vialii]|uniref:F-box protein CPR1 n=1 Tax=Rhododendron vialii TaxID=182163 RepID=UPI00265DEA02|nr:F-box protein CPR1 [Rhododendron vialii]XP_058196897.1 F-box protein CPR1 [Rhododendron vialii]XP_058196898.1 F-box protein CPR1 [Rhododendron vialii]XP_058196899.1 F-box protein CPR1 [Rhododendron vialii]